MNLRTVMLVASKGGHWIEALRLRPAFEGMRIAYVSTDPDCGSMVDDGCFHVVPDSNRWTKFGLLATLFSVLRIVASIRPDVIVSTGAAPGLLAIAVGRLFFIRTVWVESIANAEQLSLSGKFASYVASRTYVQWPELAGKRTRFEGGVCGDICYGRDPRAV